MVKMIGIEGVISHFRSPVADSSFPCRVVFHSSIEFCDRRQPNIVVFPEAATEYGGKTMTGISFEVMVCRLNVASCTLHGKLGPNFQETGVKDFGHDLLIGKTPFCCKTCDI